ncbi:MAG: hypothetical protein GF315_00270 [candidate division Zixibacteria bacterium]|nr:hypothetical protein [candidate division Zixibacteria bacterium]
MSELEAVDKKRKSMGGFSMPHADFIEDGIIFEPFNTLVLSVVCVDTIEVLAHGAINKIRNLTLVSI